MPQDRIDEFLKLPVLKPGTVIITFEDGTGVVIERLSAGAASHLQTALILSDVPHLWTVVPAPDPPPRRRPRLADAWRKLLLLLRGAMG